MKASPGYPCGITRCTVKALSVVLIPQIVDAGDAGDKAVGEFGHDKHRVQSNGNDECLAMLVRVTVIVMMASAVGMMGMIVLRRVMFVRLVVRGMGHQSVSE